MKGDNDQETTNGPEEKDAEIQNDSFQEDPS